MRKPKLPDSLTAESWNKAKGSFAKFSDKMKAVGPKVTEVSKAYAGVVWEQIDADDMAKAKTTGEAQRVMLGTKAAALKAAELVTALTQLGSAAATAQSSLKSNPLVGSSSKKWLEDVVKDAAALAKTVKENVAAVVTEVEKATADFDKNMAEIAKIGEDYIANRNIALKQMQALETMFKSNHTVIADSAAKADAAAKRAIAAPATASKEAATIVALLRNADTAATAASARWMKESSVTNNPVQAKARGNIGTFAPNPSMDGHLDAYQKQSAAVFHQIMSLTNSILPLEQQINSLMSQIRSSLAQTEDAAQAGTRSVAESQKEAAAAVKAEGIVTDELAKSADWLNTQLPKGIKNWIEQKKAQGAAIDLTVMYEKQQQIGQTHLAKVEAALDRAERLQLRFNIWPAPTKADPGVKAEFEKLDTFLKTMRPVVAQARKNVIDSANARNQIV